MDVSQVLADDLQELLVDLDHARDDLTPVGSALRRDARLVIRSYLGCVLVVPSDLGVSLRLVLADGPLDLSEAGSSLRVTWPPASPGAEPSHVTFYAARPGDLVDVAAELLTAADLDPSSLQLDVPSPEVVLHPGLAGLDDLRVAHQAVGILVAQGYSDADARSRLRSAPDVADAARSIVAAVTADG